MTLWHVILQREMRGAGERWNYIVRASSASDAVTKAQQSNQDWLECHTKPTSLPTGYWTYTVKEIKFDGDVIEFAHSAWGGW